MENKKEKIENFKIAISATVRSLSNSQKIEVFFGNHISKSEKESIKLPDLENLSNRINYEEIRAIADSKSLNYRFSNKDIFKKYEPNGNISKKLYRISEKIRCEKIGTSYFKGVKNNIEKFYEKRISSLDLKSSEDKILEAFENLLRVKLLDFSNENQIEKKLKTYKKDLNNQFKDNINNLKNLTLNQEKFNSLISKLINNLRLDETYDQNEVRLGNTAYWAFDENKLIPYDKEANINEGILLIKVNWKKLSMNIESKVFNRDYLIFLTL